MYSEPLRAWIRENLNEQDAEDVDGLIDEGWTEEDAIAFVMENPREGE